MRRETLDDWSEHDLDLAETLLKREIQREGARDVFGYALQAVRTLQRAKATTNTLTVPPEQLTEITKAWKQWGAEDLDEIRAGLGRNGQRWQRLAEVLATVSVLIAGLKDAYAKVGLIDNSDDRWIPVSELLPDRNVSVLLCFTVDGKYGAAVGVLITAREWLDTDERHPTGPMGPVWLTDEGSRFRKASVMYWRPIPDLPARWPGQTT
jgi:hypothetical protein